MWTMILPKVSNDQTSADVPILYWARLRVIRSRPESHDNWSPDPV